MVKYRNPPSFYPAISKFYHICVIFKKSVARLHLFIGTRGSQSDANNGSVILTSNQYFSDGGKLLSDNVPATALLDRLLHHTHVVNTRDQTHQLRERSNAAPATLLSDR